MRVLKHKIQRCAVHEIQARGWKARQTEVTLATVRHLRTGIIETVFKETGCGGVYWNEIHWSWLTGRNCVRNNDTYCLNVS